MTPRRFFMACLPSTGRVLPWLFMQQGTAVEISPRGSVQISQNPLACVTLARCGLGLVQTLQWIARGHGPELQEVLQDHAGRTRAFYLL